MTEWLLNALATGGVPILAVITCLSCLAMPVPASLMMLGAGALAVSGDLSLPGAMAGAFLGAVVGDQLGYRIGHAGGRWLDNRLRDGTKPALAFTRAQAMLRKRGAGAVFLSRWLLSPLGPYVNFAAGSARLPWPRFTLWAAAGEVIWVATYVSLGYFFATRITMLAQISQALVGLLAAVAVMVVAGLWLRQALRRAHRAGDRDASTS